MHHETQRQPVIDCIPQLFANQFQIVAGKFRSEVCVNSLSVELPQFPILLPVSVWHGERRRPTQTLQHAALNFWSHPLFHQRKSRDIIRLRDKHSLAIYYASRKAP